MTIRHLRIFVSVAETGNMHETARQLYIAQPAVSQAVAELEQHYHVRLFERLSRKLYITATGNQFLYYAKHILSLFGELDQQMNQTTSLTEIKIGATITIGTCLINHILKEFKGYYPDSTIKVVINTPDYLAAALLKNELDMALVENLPILSDLVCEPFLDDEMVLVSNPGHPFAQKGYATLDEISDENYIAREPGSTQELFLQFMELRSKPLKCAWFCNNSETTKQAIINNHGVTVISRRIVDKELKNASIAEIQMEGGPLMRKFYMVFHKNKYFSNALLDLKEICQNLEVTFEC